ncbi:hypothetical protein BDN71DRAFT_1436092 [Pleurotus eryngii]|uniref:Uncharacterized protein n=1 Tax=Pleurotus eryngii TaxID=5323 RepID=A0A9P5ZHS6_PLEER|nr:hypothetical protein BDN71DRAFT_1436092 [Pleurotus eryngii]
MEGTPNKIVKFIAAKCGDKTKGFEVYDSKKVYQNGDMTLSRSNDASVAQLQWGTVHYTAYLFAWLLMLRIEEVTHLKFESTDVIPGECEHFEIRLDTRKTTQTGLSHGWRLWANDKNTKICPFHALIQLANLYGSSETIWQSGSLFLQIDHNSSAVKQSSPVNSPLLGHALTTDLQCLGYKSWALYGTHSF